MSCVTSHLSHGTNTNSQTVLYVLYLAATASDLPPLTPPLCTAGWFAKTQKYFFYAMILTLYGTGFQIWELLTCSFHYFYVLFNWLFDLESLWMRVIRQNFKKVKCKKKIHEHAQLGANSKKTLFATLLCIATIFVLYVFACLHSQILPRKSGRLWVFTKLGRLAQKCHHSAALLAIPTFGSPHLSAMTNTFL